MKKCLVIPDSFKGTMTSIEVCSIMNAAILKHFPDCEVISIPIADGGEGTVDCFLQAFGGEKISIKAKGPFFEEIKSFYGITGKTAIIEMAAVAGLSKVEGNPDPAKTTTYGVGQLIEDAVKRGCNEIILGLGGSCTNDAGAGAAAALGTKFYNDSKETFIPTGETLGKVCLIDISETKKFLEGCHISVMCDVDNPLIGKTGAAHVFAPQKGADEKMVKMLDEQLYLFSKTIQSSLNIEIGMKKGAGAAGGMGAGAEAFLGADMKRGIDMILDLIQFEDILKDCDMIFTGEGKIDEQSLGGKVVIGISNRVKKVHIPVIAVVGEIGGGVSPAFDLGVSAIFSTNHRAIPYEEAKKDCRKNLSIAMDNILRLIKTVSERDCENGGEKES
jgi:glycerate kinase